MKKKSKEPWQYGKHPDPTNWQEAADALRTISKGSNRRPNPLSDKLDSIEQLLKDHK